MIYTDPSIILKTADVNRNKRCFLAFFASTATYYINHTITYEKSIEPIFNYLNIFRLNEYLACTWARDSLNFIMSMATCNKSVRPRFLVTYKLSAYAHDDSKNYAGGDKLGVAIMPYLIGR